MNRWLHSLRMQLLIAVLISSILSYAVYYGSQYLMYNGLDEYVETSDYIANKNEQSLNKFEKYVKKDKINATDAKDITSWSDDYHLSYITIIITRDNKVLYDSYNLYDDETINDYLYNYPETAVDDVTFEDGTAKVYLYGYFDTQLYYYGNYLTLILSVVSFVLCFILLIQRKIKYIKQLEEDIHILETGGLDHEITIKGKDELSRLGIGLNGMRLSLKKNIEKEEEAVNANYALVVSMAHDLRTPLTTLMLYLDLMNKGTITEDEMKEYLESSRLKAIQIKNMTDELFERFLVSKEHNIQLEEEKNVKVVFEDILSGFVGVLMQQAYTCEYELHWPDMKVSVLTSYLSRIFDNILSNILKYADKTKPIQLKVDEKDNGIYLSIKNNTYIEIDAKNSTHVGVQNIQLMMNQMHGKCNVIQDDTSYTIELWLPKANKKDS